MARTPRARADRESTPDPVDVAVGVRVRLLRKDRNMSQAALGEALGVSFQQVQKYERGANRISISTASRIARALGTTIPELVGEIDDPNHPIGGVLEGYGEPGASELVAAFGRIRRGPLRRAVIDLVRSIGEADSLED